MPNASGPETPPPTAPTSPTSPTSTVVAPSGDCVLDVDPEKNAEAAKETDVNEKSDVTAVDSKEGSLQRRLTDSLKKFTLSASSPLVLSRHRQSDGALKLVQRIEDHPQGYPQLAAFVNSDENFMICRKYGFLRSRVLLYRQDELRQLERDLLEADEEDAIACPLALRSRKTDEDREQDEFSRKPLIERIDAKLKQYGELCPPFHFQGANPQK
ncbi:hypothetical protein OEA41_008045 [Lepraria neglecta]|uniref:DUF6594 domain-containing protein n=1 Tax=Lepraria neglecta TaxID=209136 RepID=A0AAD9ZER0_9LECA|nr:hypothetical protein OEA41_008045 [Lepraria neglecta]